MCAGFRCIGSCAKSWYQSLPNFRRDLAPHGNDVGSSNGHGVAPNCTVVRDVHGFQSYLQLVAFLHVVSSDDVSHMHGATGLLQIEGGRVLLALGTERADG